MVSKYDLLLLKMVYLNQLYKSDALSLIDDSNNNNSKIVKTMVQKGWLNEREIAKVGATKETATVVAITYEGRKYLAKKFKDKFYTEIAREVQKPWNTSDPKALHRKLADNRLKTAFINAGAWVLPPDKPTLTNLYNMAYGKDTDEDEYYDNTLPLDEVLQNGVYYSVDEIRSFVERVSGESAYDIFQSAKFRGVYINNEVTALCYISNIQKNKRVKVTYNVEKRAVKVIMSLISPINSVSDLDAIVISSGNALAEMMCPSSNDKPTIISLIDWNTDIYHSVHVFPRTKLGIDSLNYMTTHNYDAWKDDCYTIFNNIPFMEPIYEHIASPQLLGRNHITHNRAIFLPWFDLSAINFVMKFHEPIDIVTREDMAQTIANIIRKPINFYDLEGNTILTQIPYHKQTEKKRISHMVSVPVSLSREDKTKIKQIAKINGQTISSYIRSVLKTSIDADYETALQKQKAEKEIRKAIRSEI